MTTEYNTQDLMEMNETLKDAKNMNDVAELEDDFHLAQDLHVHINGEELFENAPNALSCTNKKTFCTDNRERKIGRLTHKSKQEAEQGGHSVKHKMSGGRSSVHEKHMKHKTMGISLNETISDDPSHIAPVVTPKLVSSDDTLPSLSDGNTNTSRLHKSEKGSDKYNGSHVHKTLLKEMAKAGTQNEKKQQYRFSTPVSKPCKQSSLVTPGRNTSPKKSDATALNDNRNAKRFLHSSLTRGKDNGKGWAKTARLAERDLKSFRVEQDSLFQADADYFNQIGMVMASVSA